MSLWLHLLFFPVEILMIYTNTTAGPWLGNIFTGGLNIDHPHRQKPQARKGMREGWLRYQARWCPGELAPRGLTNNTLLNVHLFRVCIQINIISNFHFRKKKSDSIKRRWHKTWNEMIFLFLSVLKCDDSLIVNGYYAINYYALILYLFTATSNCTKDDRRKREDLLVYAGIYDILSLYT